MPGVVGPSGQSGGSGTVTSVSASGGVETTTGSAITTTGAVRSVELVDARTTATEALLDAARGKLVTFGNAGATAVSIAQAGAAGNFASGWWVDVKVTGAGTVTITPATSTIDGAATLVLTTGQKVRVQSNGTNYISGIGNTSPLGAASATSLDLPVTKLTGAADGGFFGSSTTYNLTSAATADASFLTRHFFLGGAANLASAVSLAINEGGGNFTMGNYYVLGWSSGSAGAANPFYSSADIGLGRNAVGVAEVNSGVAGTFRDIKVRDAFLDGQKSLAALATNSDGKIITAASDARLKDIEGTFEAGLAEILAIEPKRFTWKDGRMEGTQAGLIAQNVQESISLAVSAVDDEIGTLQINKDAIIAALINAVKEMNARLLRLEGA